MKIVLHNRDYGSLKNHLIRSWGFSPNMAGFFAVEIETGRMREYSKIMNSIKKGRLKHVEIFYKDLGGTSTRPRFPLPSDLKKTDDKRLAEEARRRADDQLKQWGWRVDDTNTYFQVYYYGLTRRSEYTGLTIAFKSYMKNLRNFLNPKMVSNVKDIIK